jgi:superfamily I DNA/RNA helicase
VGQLRELARQQGVVYTLTSGEWSWSLPYVRAAVVYEKLRKGQRVLRNEAKVMSPYLTSPLPDRLPNELAWGDLFGDDLLESTWMTALPNMAVGDREYVRALRRSGESLSKPGRVRIGTVHSVKGAEADNVALLTDVSLRVQHGARVDPDSELRVQYVGVTRAKHTLHLVQPTTPTHWTF